METGLDCGCHPMSEVQVEYSMLVRVLYGPKPDEDHVARFTVVEPLAALSDTIHLYF